MQKGFWFRAGRLSFDDTTLRFQEAKSLIGHHGGPTEILLSEVTGWKLSPRIECLWAGIPGAPILSVFTVNGVARFQIWSRGRKAELTKSFGKPPEN